MILRASGPLSSLLWIRYTLGWVGMCCIPCELLSRPLAFYFARYFSTGNHPENITWFDSLWQYREFRHMMYVITIVWGIGFLFEADFRTFLVMVLSTEQFVIISPFVLYGIIGMLIAWMFLYSRQGREKGEALRQRMQAEQGASSL
jgi:hypothetical protein